MNHKGMPKWDALPHEIVDEIMRARAHVCIFGSKAHVWSCRGVPQRRWRRRHAQEHYSAAERFWLTSQTDAPTMSWRSGSKCEPIVVPSDM